MPRFSSFIFPTGFQALAQASGKQAILAVATGDKHGLIIDDIVFSTDASSPVKVWVKVASLPAAHGLTATVTAALTNRSKTAFAGTAFRSKGTIAVNALAGDLAFQTFAIAGSLRLRQLRNLILPPDKVIVVEAETAADCSVGVVLSAHYEPHA
jgi:hypothetical protein